MKKLMATAFIVGVCDLFVLMGLMFSDNVFSGHGFAPLAILCFFIWFACVFTVIGCLIAIFVKKAGLSSSPISASAFCPHCGKPVSAGTAFCAHCGGKL